MEYLRIKETVPIERAIAHAESFAAGIMEKRLVIHIRELEEKLEAKEKEPDEK